LKPPKRLVVKVIPTVEGLRFDDQQHLVRPSELLLVIDMWRRFYT
jgi:hypothetical protein